MSLLEISNLPAGFGYLLLVFGLILTLAPWFHGNDFGILKIPSFGINRLRVLKYLGPIFLMLAIALHLPLTILDKAPARMSDKKPDLPQVSTPDAEVFAEWQNSGCLYSARVQNRDHESAHIKFRFDKSLTVPLDEIFAATKPEFIEGERHYIKITDRNAWLPVAIRDLKQTKAQIVPDETAKCADDFGKKTKWVFKSDLMLFLPIGG